MRAFTATMLSLCAALVLAPPDTASATIVVIEKGGISGRASLAPIFTGNLPTATGAFTLDPGDEDVPGLDYSSISPGAFSLVINPFTYVWSGSFSAPADMSLIDFEVGTSSFTTTIFGLSVVVGDTLDFSSTLSTLTILPPLPPLPGTLTDPSVRGHLEVTQVFLLGVTPIAFDFSGTYEIRASQTAIPEPGSMALLGAGLAGLARLALFERRKLAL